MNPMNFENPAHEHQRLAALYRYSILDTPPEKRFDEITQLATELFNAPIAAITFMDEHRQWYKSKIGIEFQQIPRLDSFCNHTLQNRETVIIPDLSQDFDFCDHPFVTNLPRVRFYAATPLMTTDGFPIGTLCVMDFHPRILNPIHVRTLEHLGRTIVMELESELNLNQMKRFESALKLSSRLASLGEVSAGIGHEINNPLAVIKLRVAHLRRLAETEGVTSETVRLCTDKVEQGVERIHAIVKGLSTFSRSGSEDPIQSISLSSVVQDAIFFFEDRLQNAGIQFTVEDYRKHDSIRLNGKIVQVAQVILNLLINARDAVEETKGKKWIRLSFQVEPTVLKIKVSDSAPVIPPSVESQLFQRFFTTKKDKGTGLGLNVSRALIEAFGGKLYLEQTATKKAFVIELTRSN